MHDFRKCFKISKNAPVFAKLHEFKSEQIILNKNKKKTGKNQQKINNYRKK
jgi:hypothetical protein